MAAVIVAVGLTGVAGAFSYSAQVSRLAADSMVAEQLAATMLARAREAGIANLTGWDTYPGETGTSGLEGTCSEMLGQSGLAAAHASLTVTDVQTGLKGVTVVVEWGTTRPGGRVETETLLSERF